MSTDFRALCAELVSSWDNANGDQDLCGLADIMDRARSALDQSAVAGPTADDFRALCAELLSALVEYGNAIHYHDYHELIRRAETALDQPPAPGMRREYIYNPTQMAECGGPCWEAQDPRGCDCGALWRDVPLNSVTITEGPVQRGQGNGGPSTPKPAIVPRPQGISSPRSADSSPRSADSSPRSADSSPRSDGSSPRSDATAPIARCPGEGHWDGAEFHWLEGCDDCRRRTAAEGPVTVRPPRIITFECHYRIDPDA